MTSIRIFKENSRMAGNKPGKNCQLRECWVWPKQVEEKIKPFIGGTSIPISAI